MNIGYLRRFLWFSRVPLKQLICDLLCVYFYVYFLCILFSLESKKWNYKIKCNGLFIYQKGGTIEIQQEKERERVEGREGSQNRDLPGRFGRGWSREPGTLPWSLAWTTGSQRLGPSSTAFSGMLTWSKMEQDLNWHCKCRFKYCITVPVLKWIFLRLLRKKLSFHPKVSYQFIVSIVLWELCTEGVCMFC